ncbi:Teichoic acid translocation permease protein TagG [compost metagenome]
MTYHEQNSDKQWTEVIEPSASLLNINLKEVWRYRDLLFLLVHRDFVTFFKQTILGPIWFFVSPIFTTIIFTFVFGNIAKISTDGVPQVAFYLCGVTLWNYFSSALTATSSVFKNNAAMLGKVYFPRLIMPLSIVVSNLMQFAIQFGLFILVVIYYVFKGTIEPNWWILATPFLIALMVAYSLGLGMIFSSLTTKYKDLSMLLTFGVTLYMYATPVIFPVSVMPKNLRPLVELNPLTAIFECFKYGYLGAGHISWGMLAYSTVVIVITLIIGTLVFNKVEKGFMDTV